jgi:hypothetical protein
VFEQYIHPNDRAIRDQTGLDMTYRIVRPEGAIRYTHSVVP